MFLIFELFLPLYVLTSEVAVVKSHHGITVKCSRYRDTGPTDPSLWETIQICHKNDQYKHKNSIRDARTPQPGEIVFNTIRYRSTETVHRLAYFQGSAGVQIVFKLRKLHLRERNCM